MCGLNGLLMFLEELEERKIYYQLNKIRDSILVEIAVPGQRWEVEFMANGSIVMEKFLSDGTIYNEEEIKTLFRDYSDK